MNKKIILSVLSSAFIFIASNVSAENTLSGDEIKTIFSNKTFEGRNLVKGKNFKAFSSADGTHTIHTQSGKVKKRYWRVEGNKHCVSKKTDRGGKCRRVVSKGDGVYEKIDFEDEPTHRLKNFVEGNKL